MSVQAPPMTAKEFEEFVLLPQNADARLELIAGEVVTLVSNQESSRLAAEIIYLLRSYLKNNPIGFITSSDGGYQVGNDRYIPDAAFMSKARQATASNEAYNSLPPDLAVEVVSPTDDMGDVLAKVNNYQLAGTVVWVVFPNKKEIGVFTPGQTAKTLGVKDVLEGGEVLPGLKLALRDLFAEASN